MARELREIANQDNWSEVYHLAEGYRQQQQWQQAAIAFQQAIELRPTFFWSYHHLGDALSHLQQWQQAAFAYNQAVKLDSNFFWSWHNLADVHSKLQQWQQAAFAYSQAVKLDSNFFWSWHNLADVHSKLQQSDLAIAAYLKALSIQPDHQLTTQKLGTALKQRASLEKSIKDYRQLIVNPSQQQVFSTFQNNLLLLINIADNLAKAQQISGAIILYYIVLEIDPQQIQVLLILAQLLQKQNQLAQTIASRQPDSASNLLTRQTKQNIPQAERDYLPGKIIVKSDRSVSPEELEDLCCAVGWARRPLMQVKQSLTNSFSCIAAWHINNNQKQLIGFGRAVADGVFQATLLDILVHPHFQQRGIGKAIVQTLLNHLHNSEIKDITLFASPHIVDFYHQLGFISQPNNLQWMLWCPKQKS
jgi:tetratricopeptide (TPR) repeat protein/N-acetylglutamate synthase-like GNAT family acetyltransferase